MRTIKALLGFPNGTPIDAATVRITKVWEHKTINTAYGEKTIQSGMIEDSTGKMKFKAWSHPNLSVLEGKEVVIHDSNGKGLKVVLDSYTGREGPKTDIVLEVGKAGQFQLVAVYNQTKGVSGPPEAQGVPTSGSMPQKPANAKETGFKGSSIHGATAGAAVNKAIDILIDSGVAYEAAKAFKLEEAIVAIAGRIAKAALRIESGDFGQHAQPTKVEAPKAPPAPEPAPEDDVPWGQ